MADLLAFDCILLVGKRECGPPVAGYVEVIQRRVEGGKGALRRLGGDVGQGEGLGGEIGFVGEGFEETSQ